MTQLALRCDWKVYCNSVVGMRELPINITNRIFNWNWRLKKQHQDLSAWRIGQVTVPGARLSKDAMAERYTVKNPEKRKRSCSYMSRCQESQVKSTIL